MRNEFAKTITELAKKKKDIILLAGDIGNRLFDKFKKNNPERFYNCGVAEANMTGVASGLASSGLKPITYTITPFNTARCFEQIRLDICYPNLPVIIVGTGSGLSYASLGATHHSMEDIAILKTLPNLQIICPGDQKEVREALIKAYESNKPTYIRLGKKGEPIIHKKKPKFEIGKSIFIKKGEDIAILGVGNALSIASNCEEMLREKKIYSDLISFHTPKPIDEKLLKNLFKSNKLIVVIEEHGLIGGVGSSILEWANNNKLDIKNILRFGGPDRFLTGCGNQNEARDFIGLTPKKICNQIIYQLKKK
ncbi:transketolase [Candidatus Pelagibacter ubique]|nr:transketolase [Candidatus Pelagibacter ubique]